MERLRVRPATLAHVLQMSKNLRPADEAEVRAGGDKTGAQALIGGLGAGSAFSVVDAEGQVVFMFGVAPTGEPEVGAPWMLATPLIHQHVRWFLRHAPKAVRALGAGYEELRNWVDHRNVAHVRWLKRMGFSFTPHRDVLAPSGVRFLAFEMRFNVRSD